MWLFFCLYARMKKLPFILLAVLLLACNNESVIKLKAGIFERKTLPGKKLLLSYEYKNGNKLVKDSCIVDNAVIPRDTINVEITGTNPVKTKPFLP